MQIVAFDDQCIIEGAKFEVQACILNTQHTAKKKFKHLNFTISPKIIILI